jgi:hypothetical protein
MPLLYGEETNAFVRLQEEIIKISADQSILVWKPPSSVYDPLSYTAGVLANCPGCFMGSSAVSAIFAGDVPYAMANLGLNIQLSIQAVHTPVGLLHVAVIYDRSKGHELKDGQEFRTIVLRYRYANRYEQIHYDLSSDHTSHVEEATIETINLIQRVDFVEPQQSTNAFGVVFCPTAVKPYLRGPMHVFCDDPNRMSFLINQLPSHEHSFHFVVAPFPRPVPTTDSLWVAIALSFKADKETSLVAEFGIMPSLQDQPTHVGMWMRCAFWSRAELFPSQKSSLVEVQALYHPLSALPVAPNLAHLSSIVRGPRHMHAGRRYALPSDENPMVLIEPVLPWNATNNVRLSFMSVCKLLHGRLIISVDIGSSGEID